MEFWIKAAQLLLSLSILVVLHEFGHYIPARLFKTRVEKFYLFFNYKFSLFKKKIGETEWGIGWIPLGGYVKIAGMIDESMDKEQMKQPAKPWEFRSKPAWQRLIIMTGGVIVNLVLGMLIYVFVLFGWGDQRVDIDKLENGMQIHPYMEQFGVASGDVITKVGDHKVQHTTDVARHIMVRGADNLTVKHPDGSTEVIQLPEHIDYNIFKNVGQGSVASLRTKNAKIEVVGVTKDHAQEKYKENYQIKKIDGKPLSKIDVSDPKFLSKGHTITFSAKGEKVKAKLSKKEMTQLLKDSPALAAGLKVNDEVVEVNGQELVFTDAFSSALYNSKKEKLDIVVKRGNKEVPITIKVPKNGRIGIVFSYDEPEDAKDALYTQEYGFGESWGAGISRGYWTLHDYVAQMKFIFTEKGAGSLGGFGAIGGLFAPTWDWHSFWANTALISIILAFMNILPIPALDGGHVVFLLYEMITGREAPEKVLEIAQYIGIVVILGLVIYANGNDIYRYFFS